MDRRRLAFRYKVVGGGAERGDRAEAQARTGSTDGQRERQTDKGGRAPNASRLRAALSYRVVVGGGRGSPSSSHVPWANGGACGDVWGRVASRWAPGRRRRRGLGWTRWGRRPWSSTAGASGPTPRAWRWTSSPCPGPAGPVSRLRIAPPHPHTSQRDPLSSAFVFKFERAPPVADPDARTLHGACHGHGYRRPAMAVVPFNYISIPLSPPSSPTPAPGSPLPSKPRRLHSCSIAQSPLPAGSLSAGKRIVVTRSGDRPYNASLFFD
jgi:hypothetical protein